MKNHPNNILITTFLITTHKYKFLIESKNFHTIITFLITTHKYKIAITMKKQNYNKLITTLYKNITNEMITTL